MSAERSRGSVRADVLAEEYKGQYLWAEIDRLRIAEQALRDITRCDYRGNEPHEQMIARLALADMERDSMRAAINHA